MTTMVSCPRCGQRMSDDFLCCARCRRHFFGGSVLRAVVTLLLLFVSVTLPAGLVPGWPLVLGVISAWVAVDLLRVRRLRRRLEAQERRAEVQAAVAQKAATALWWTKHDRIS